MPDRPPGLETQLRAARDDEGLEKAMAFAAVRNALVGDTLELAGDMGKYRVLERLGAGGMGAVFAAWDSELERRVALKVLVGTTEADAEQKLIMREAKAAAQLSHPNVVTVFEVGVARGRVFLAMEYVRGETLRAWLGENPPPNARIAVLMGAGRGLAAAHACGLVHRDFKPDNVLVDADGRAKVVDFGLAHSSTESLVSSQHDADAPTRASPLTQTGSRSGTPHYMAPEALQGVTVDARSDQFSFAVSAWEALCGQRPFEDNEDPRAPRGRPMPGVPRTTAAALQRALSPAPADRFASMEALLEAIDPARRVARRNRWLLGGAGVLSIGALAWGFRPHEVPTATLCTGAHERLEGVWDAPRRDAFEAAFASADAQAGAEAWTRTAATLDTYADAWVAASTDACEATRVRGDQSDETLTLRNRCLDGRLRALRGLTERFSTLDADTVSRAPSAAAALPEIDDCADPAFLSAQVEPPPARIAEEVRAAQLELATLEAGEELGQYKEVAGSVPGLVERAASLEHRPLAAEVGYLQGRMHQRMGAFPDARAALEQVVLDATASRHDHLLAKALSLLALVVGHDLGDRDAGLSLLDQAQAALTRLGGDDELEAQLLSRRGLILLRASDLPEARAQLELAAEMFSERLADGVQYGDTKTNLANISIALGEWDRALDELGAALEVFEAFHGEEHPAVGAVLGNRAIVFRNLERLDEARQSFARAREIFAAAQGETHPRVAAIDLNLGNVELQAGNTNRALALFDAAAKSLQASLGEEHVWVAKAVSARGHALASTGDPRAGVADLERAIALFEAQAPDSIDLGRAYCYLGAGRAALGETSAANAAFDAAFSRLEAALGPEFEAHADVLDCRDAQAAVLSGR
ncbi:MAG: protein kinase domain-containing protein [Nannocystaceae bacterium]|nr:serine/threonine-protein kinase [bacterium]